jgi:hypothetical protein
MADKGEIDWRHYIGIGLKVNGGSGRSGKVLWELSTARALVDFKPQSPPGLPSSAPEALKALLFSTDIAALAERFVGTTPKSRTSLESCDETKRPKATLRKAYRAE